MTPPVVFDCMVFLQGAGRPTDPAAACLRLVDESQVVLYVSADILAEVCDVLTRPETLHRLPRLSPGWVEFFVRHLQSKGGLVRAGSSCSCAAARPER